MAPNLEEFIEQSPVIPYNGNINLLLSPLTVPDEHDLPEPELHSLEDEWLQGQNDYLPEDLRSLLIKSANTENFGSITHIKLKVISSEISLQQLGIYCPALRDLVLDGSIIMTLRDLGSGLKNLRVLSLNRCQLNKLDALLSFEYLEELYATDNNITDLVPCAFLSNLKVLDVRRNAIKMLGTLSFLALCQNLKQLCLEGNVELQLIPGLRGKLKKLLPGLEILDGIPTSNDVEESVHCDLKREKEFSEKINDSQIVQNTIKCRRSLNSPRGRQGEGNDSPFIINFPPKLFSINTGHVHFRGDQLNVFRNYQETMKEESKAEDDY